MGDKNPDTTYRVLAAKRDLAADAEWKIIQKNTFTRWADEHLKRVGKRIVDLEKDLSDGLLLISLVELLSGKKIEQYNKQPTRRVHKFENVTNVLHFLEHEEHVRLVNIGTLGQWSVFQQMHINMYVRCVCSYVVSYPLSRNEVLIFMSVSLSLRGGNI
jgi:filamin